MLVQVTWRNTPKNRLPLALWSTSPHAFLECLLSKFLDTSNPNFATFHNALHNVFRDLSSKRVGAQARQTEAFSMEDEEALWESGALGCDTLKRLLRNVSFLKGKNVCLRGGAEQRNLKISQLKRLKDPMIYVYTENVSKNRAGGLAQIPVKNKFGQLLLCQRVDIDAMFLF